MSAPRQLVSPPVFRDRQFGLLSVVDPRYDELDVHWRNGVTWQDICGIAGTTYDPCAVDGTPDAKAGNITVNTFGARPFTVFAEVNCSPVGYSQEEQRARAVDALTRSEPFQVERAFWTGAAGGDAGVVLPHLAANAAVLDSTILPIASLQCAATTVTGSTVLDPVEAVGRLEFAFSQLYGGQGILHVPSSLAATFRDHWIVETSGQQAKTTLGNLVAFGAGYTGSSPAGVVAANVAWVYMTGPIFAYRSGPEAFRFSEMLDRTDNTLQTIVERTYVLGYSCCTLMAVAVSLGGEVTGQPLSAF